MDEALSEYYNDRVRAIRRDSWEQAFFGSMAVIMVLLGIWFLGWVFFVEKGPGRIIVTMLAGFSGLVAVVRWVMLRYQLSKLKLEVARRAMLQ
jgi:hypothetical protein